MPLAVTMKYPTYVEHGLLHAEEEPRKERQPLVFTPPSVGHTDPPSGIAFHLLPARYGYIHGGASFKFVS